MIKAFLKALREYKKPALLSTLFVLGEVVMQVLIPVLMSKLLDDGLRLGDMKLVWRMSALILVLMVLFVLFGILAGRSAAIASSGFARNLRHDMYRHLQEFSFSNIDKFKTASIITRMTTDVGNVQGAFEMLLCVMIQAPIMLISAMCASFYINVYMALIVLAVSPVLLCGLILIFRHVHPIYIRVFKHIDHMNNVVQENVRGIRVVKSYVREEHEVEKFSKASKFIRDESYRAETTLALSGPLMMLCIYICILLISWFGAKLIVRNEMSIGGLSSMFTYNMYILSSLMMISSIIVTVVISRTSAERIVELLNERPDITNPDNPVMNVEDGSIVFDNVSFSYSDNAEQCCLSNIDLHIKSGETVGIIGGIGSGKSSFVQLIPRLYDVTTGSIRVGGVDVREYDLEVLRSNVAMVLQKNELFSGTIKENLRWGDPDASDEEMIQACQVAQADSFVSSFPDGYDTFIEQGGANVSGGQKQRLCIARAILRNPKILILDDSTSAVDTATDALIQENLKNCLPDVTKLVIAQRISSVENADHIIVLDKGTVVDVGTHEELLGRNQIYQEVYESQRKGADQ